MILILGDSEDALIYFRTRLGNGKTENIAGGTAYFGQIGAEEVIMASTSSNNYLSILTTSEILAKYEPYLVISIGGCTSFSSSLHVGDLFIADRYYNEGIDYSGDGVTGYGHLPGFPPFYSSDTSLNNQTEACVYDTVNRYVRRGFMLSGDKLILSNKQIDPILKNHFAGVSRLSVYDTASYGIATACYLRRTALLTLKVVSRETSSPERAMFEKREVLEAMPAFGKIIDRLFIEMERE